MGDGTKENPYTREDVLRLIKENGGKAEGLDLSGKVFEGGIDLHGLDLQGIILNGASFPPKIVLADLEPNMRPDEPRTVKEIIGANLQGVDFSKGLLRSTYLWEADLQKAKFYYCDMQKACLEQTKLQETDLSWAQLQGANFEGAYFYKTDLHGAKFDSATSFDFAQWADYMLGEEEKGLFGLAEDTYRRLKQWYTNAGYSDTAAKFYYREKEANRKRLKLLSRDWHHRVASELIRAIFGYGERWWNIVFSIEALILLFAFTYLAIAASWEWWRILLLGWIPGLIIWFAYLKFTTSLNWTWWKKAPFWAAGMVFLFCSFYFLSGLLTSEYLFWRYLYFSTVSFTALGYGEWAKLSDGLASDFIKGIGAFESLVGISTLALLLVTFFRKWTR